MKWTVGTKIGIGFGIVTLILVIKGVVTYNSTSALVEATNRVMHTHDAVDHISGVLVSMIDAETGQRGYASTNDPKYLEPYDLGISRVGRQLTELRTLTEAEPIQQARLDALEPMITRKLQLMHDSIQQQQANGPDATKQAASGIEGKAVMDAIRAKIDEMQNDEQAELSALSDSARATAVYARRFIIACTALAFASCCICGFFITRNISKPLIEITRAAERLAVGDLDVLVSAASRKDEVGVLARTFAIMADWLRATAETATKIAEGDLRVKVQPQSAKDRFGNAFAAMVQNLQHTTTQISEGVGVLMSAANQISTSTSQLAAGAAETAAAIRQATTTVEEVRQAAQISSQKARTVSDNAQNISQISQGGAKSSEETITGMSRIRTQMETIADTTVRLSEQTQLIGQIVASVEDLAAQSNLLAVNASIEAAKAGEHGKGFGVVAQEVRTLAEQSRHATGQVRTILADIQKATTAAVSATEQGSQAVDNGVKQSALAGKSIATLSETITQSAQAATQIAASSQQQLIGVDQVAAAMETVKQASAQYADGAKQLESAARNLKDLGSKLKISVEMYKIQ